ncbi:MAG: DPP IV N-terminal domain-containing protein [Candidatus Riflebacteria bacterium]
MYCFRCGKKLPPRVINCPECDTPQKRRQRYRTRMILGLFIFLAGAVAGSLFDTIFFKGSAWDHSFAGILDLDHAKTGKNDVQEISSASEPLVLNAIQENASAAPEITASEPALPLEIGSYSLVNLASAAADSISASAPASQVFDSTSQPVATSSANQSQGETTIDQISPDNNPDVDSTRLKYSMVKPLVKEEFNSYHAFIARNLQEMVFSADSFKVGNKNLYQCFTVKLGADQTPERAFEWPGNVWTPETTEDGKAIVFSSDSRSPEQIFVFDRSSRQSKALTAGTSKNMMPAVSPDGSLVAYVSNEKGNNDIWLIGIDGSSKLQITSTPEDDREPRWLPDGKGLVFTRIFEPLKKSNIMKIMLEPLGEATELVNSGGRNWLADVSPDGRSLAFVRSLATDGSKNTLIIKNLLDKSEKEIRPLGNADCFRPVWFPDSSGIVFHANVNRSKKIYVAVLEQEQQD